MEDGRARVHAPICAQLPNDLPCLHSLHRRGAQALHQVTQQLPIEELHRKKYDICVSDELEYIDDVPM